MSELNIHDKYDQRSEWLDRLRHGGAEALIGVEIEVAIDDIEGECDGDSN